MSGLIDEWIEKETRTQQLSVTQISPHFYNTENRSSRDE